MSKLKKEERKPTVDELLAKAKKPSMLAPKLPGMMRTALTPPV